MEAREPRVAATPPLQPAEHDRRVKLIVRTEEGHRVRREIERRITEPPRAIADLPRTDQVALRDILRRAPADDPAG
jgi:hypothetical protein